MNDEILRDDGMEDANVNVDDNIQNEHVNIPSSDEKVEIPTMKVIPLKKICMTIGQLPTAYIETMSYYEMLVWFIEFLRNNVIPTVNNNGEAVKELQTIVMTLQNYINTYKQTIDEEMDNFQEAVNNDILELEDYMNNYFNNLDVQEEINNKLDQMLEDGVLEQIIEQFLQLTSLICFDNVADMKSSVNLANGSYAKTLGYYSKNDGGSSLYKIRTITNDDIVDEMFIIEMENSEVLIAELIKDEFINIKQLGIREDIDESTKFQSILSKYNQYLIPSGSYILKDIQIPSNTILDVKGTITNPSGTSIFKIENKENVCINGGKYVGDNETIDQMLIEINSSNDCILSDMTLIDSLNKDISITGSSKNNTIKNINVSGATSSTGVGISLLGANVEYNVIKHIYATTSRVGVSLNGASNNSVSDIKCYNNTLMGLTIDGIVSDSGDGGHHNNVENIIVDTITSNSYAGVYIGNGSSYNNFSNIVIRNTTSPALRQVHPETHQGLYNNFNNVICSNISNSGIQFTGAYYNNLSNFNIDTVTGRGITFGRSDYCNISNGSISHCSQDGIFIQSGYTNINNIKVHNNATGIQLAFGGGSSPINNIISNIDFQNNTTNFIGVSQYIIDNTSGYVVHNYGKISKANNQTIAHGLSTTPKLIIVSSSVTDHNVSVIDSSSTTFTIGLTDSSGTPITTAEDIYWEARL